MYHRKTLGPSNSHYDWDIGVNPDSSITEYFPEQIPIIGVASPKHH